MIDWNKPIEYVCGPSVNPARVICKDRKTNNGFKYVVLTESAAKELVFQVDENGHDNYGQIIRNKKEKKKYWVYIGLSPATASVGVTALTFYKDHGVSVGDTLPGYGTFGKIINILEGEYEI